MNNLETEAILLYNSGDFLASADKYQQLLQQDQNNAEVWLNLGIVYLSMGLPQDALDMILQSIDINSENATAHYTIGLIFEQLGNIAHAAHAYQNAIALNPTLIDAYNNLGNILYADGKIDLAESFYRQAIAVNPEHLGSYINLGNVLISQQRTAEAIAIYQTALKLYPEHTDIVNNLEFADNLQANPTTALIYFGNELYRRGEYQEAINKYQEFLARETGDISCYLILGECAEKLQQYSLAINTYRTAIAIYPSAANLYLKLITAWRESGNTEEAIALAEQASTLFNDDLYFKFIKNLTLPIIYKTSQEIELYRHKFNAGLENLIQTTSLKTIEQCKQALTAISKYTTFFLAYQGLNDLDIQKKYGQFVSDIMAANYPEWVKPISMPSPAKKLRIGYVSAFLKNHPGAKWALGWIENHDRENFEIYCYYTSYDQDLITQQFQLHSDVFHHIADNLEALCQQLIIDNLHIIVYPAIGMNPQATQLAALRLAPIQCTAWGHPITSGLSTIDYYLSSELMEPINAQEHYNEKVICLPNIGICYPKPALPEKPKTRADLNLKQDSIIFLCSQMLCKYLPQYDYIYATIAQQIPQAQFVFISRPNSYVVEQFSQRLQAAFNNFNLNSQDYCVFLPVQDQIGYISLNLVSDIFLDTFTWSGGNTTLEAIACNLPIVTCPGEFMRGRHSYAFLTMLGVTETIAKDESEYIKIALRLALDIKWKQHIINIMQNNHDRLYNDKMCVAGLEAFYQSVVQEFQLKN